jgi:hypothetical protein
MPRAKFAALPDYSRRFQDRKFAVRSPWPSPRPPSETLTRTAGAGKPLTLGIAISTNMTPTPPLRWSFTRP